MFVSPNQQRKVATPHSGLFSHGKETTTLEQQQLRSPQCQPQTSNFLIAFFTSCRFISFTRTDHSNVFNPLHKIRIKFVLQAGRQAGKQAGRQTRETMNTKSINRQESFSKSIYCRRKCLKQPSLRRPLASHEFLQAGRQAGKQAGRQTRETMNTKSINRQESFSKSIYCRRKCLKQPSLRRPLASHNSCRQAGKQANKRNNWHRKIMYRKGKTSNSICFWRKFIRITKFDMAFGIQTGTTCYEFTLSSSLWPDPLCIILSGSSR